MPDFPPDNALLFVYGTLQRGGMYHPLLEACGARFVGRASTLQAYPLLLDRYPCLMDAPGTGFRVSGEVYRIRHAQSWWDLDQLEGHPHEYRRRLEPVELAGEVREAWTYFFLLPDTLQPGLRPVERYDPGAYRSD